VYHENIEKINILHQFKSINKLKLDITKNGTGFAYTVALKIDRTPHTTDRQSAVL